MNRLINQQVCLKPQDLMVLFKISLPNQVNSSYAQLAEQLEISASAIHASVKRARMARLIVPDDNGVRLDRAAFRDFIIYGAKYAFPATFGQVVRGMPTSYAASPLKEFIIQSEELPPVWPYEDGRVRGVAFYPLYPTIPLAAEKDPLLYEMLSLFDCIRGGAARERELAIKILSERLL